MIIKPILPSRGVYTHCVGIAYFKGGMTIPNIKSLDPECETPKSQEPVQLWVGTGIFLGGLAKWNHIFMLGDSYLLELELDINCSKIVPCRNRDFFCGPLNNTELTTQNSDNQLGCIGGSREVQDFNIPSTSQPIHDGDLIE